MRSVRALVLVLDDLVEQAVEQVAIARLGQDPRHQFGALLLAVDDRLDADLGRALQLPWGPALGGVGEAGAALLHGVEVFEHRQRGLADERRGGELHGGAWIAPGPDHRAEVVVERVVEIGDQLVDHGLRVDAFGEAVEDAARHVGFDPLDVDGQVRDAVADEGVGDRVAAEQART